VPRTELSNGYIVAEILQRYRVPEGFQEIYLPSFENGAALQTKLSNWTRLKTILKDNKFAVSEAVIDATIHCKRGAAEHFLQLLHAHLTTAKIPGRLARSPDFSDTAYQTSLPYYARSTTSSLIKSNVRPLEAKTTPDTLAQEAAVTGMVAGYAARNRDDRAINPARYDRRPLDEKGLPTLAAPLEEPVVDFAEMHQTAQFVKLTARQKPLAPIQPRRAAPAGAVGPVGHTTAAAPANPLNVTKRRDEPAAEAQ